MKRLRVPLLAIVTLVLGASCASILGIQEPETVGETTGSSSSSASASGGGASVGGGTSTGGGKGGSSSGGGTGGTGGVDCNVLKYCPNSDPPCVDTSSDHDNCGMCDHPCDPTRACVLGICATPHPLTPARPHQLSSSGNHYIASALSVPSSGATLVVGGALSGTNPLGDGNDLMFPDPFVWQVPISDPSQNKLESLCQVNHDCGSATVGHTCTDVAIGTQQDTQLLGDFGLLSLDSTLGLINLDTTKTGTGLGLSTASGAQLAIAGEASVTVFALSSGQPTTEKQFRPLNFEPASDVPVHVTRANDLVVVGGGLNGPGPVSLGDGMATVVGARDAFVGVYNADASLSWFKTFPSTHGASASITAITNDGSNIYFVGQYQTSIDLGSGPGQGRSCGVLHASAGQTQNFVARYDLNGDCFWARSFGSAYGTQDTPTGILEFTSSVMIVGATTASSANFGGQDLSVPSPLFMLILGAGDGSYTYSWAYGHDATAQATGQPVGIGTRDGEDVWIAGYYTGGSMSDLSLAPADPTHPTSYLLHFPASQFP